MSEETRHATPHYWDATLMTLAALICGGGAVLVWQVPENSTLYQTAVTACLGIVVLLFIRRALQRAWPQWMPTETTPRGKLFEAAAALGIGIAIVGMMLGSRDPNVGDFAFGCMAFGVSLYVAGSRFMLAREQRRSETAP